MKIQSIKYFLIYSFTHLLIINSAMSQPTPTIRLAFKEIFIEQSEILYQSNEITKENFAKDWDIKSGEWKVENG